MSFKVNIEPDENGNWPTDANGNPLQVQLAGSNNTFYGGISATATDANLQFGFTTKQVTVKNDGSNILGFTLDGNPSYDGTYPYNGSQWTLTAGWTAQTINGINYTQSNSISDNAVFNVGIEVNTITFGHIDGTAGGITDFQLSTDGTNWFNPSAISGVSRSDGATGTSMDSLDQYNATNSTSMQQIMFYLPYTADWRLKVVPSGTKNASSSNTYAMVVAGSVQGTNTYLLKSSEQLELDVAATKIHFSSINGATGRVYAS